jgi:hypothetical protein
MSNTIEPICHFTPEGQTFLQESEDLQQALDAFWDSESPEWAIGGRFIGTGKFSSVRLIGGVALKISSPTSSQYSYENGKATRAERLTAQFSFLRALGTHLQKTDPTIYVPQQFFAAHSKHDAYLLGQEYMEGWMPIADWADKNYPPEEDAAWSSMSKHIKGRIEAAVAGTKLRRGLNDLRLEKPGIHGDNILIPQDAEPTGDMPLCILDQPGLAAKHKNVTE